MLSLSPEQTARCQRTILVCYAGESGHPSTPLTVGFTNWTTKMAITDRLSTLLRMISLSEEPPRQNVDQTTQDLAADAASANLTPEDLVACGVHLKRPILDHLNDDEQPEYLFRGGELLISDREGNLSRNHPSGEMRVVITDRRVLFVQGGRRNDTLIAVPLSDVVTVYIDDEEMRRYLVVETNYTLDDDNHETDSVRFGLHSLLGGRELGEEGTMFFGDVSLESRMDALSDGIQYIRAHAPQTTED